MKKAKMEATGAHTTFIISLASSNWNYCSLIKLLSGFILTNPPGFLRLESFLECKFSILKSKKLEASSKLVALFS